MDILEELIKVETYFIGDFNGKFLMMEFSPRADVEIKTMFKDGSKDTYFCVTGEDVVYLKTHEDKQTVYTIKRYETGFELFDDKETGYKMVANFTLQMIV